jgi:hypothetical protein
MLDDKTFTNNKDTGNIDIEHFCSVATEVQELFLDSFKSVPVQVDESLEGNRYYVAVSRELFEQISQRY